MGRRAGDAYYLKESNAINVLYRLWKILPSHRKKQFFWLNILMLLSAIAELISLGSLYPFFSLIAGMGENNLPGYALKIINFFNLNSIHTLYLVVSAFGVSIVLSCFLRLLCLKLNTDFSYASGADLNVIVFKKTLCQEYLDHLNSNSSEVIDAILNKTAVVISTFTMTLSLLNATFLISFIAVGLIYINWIVAAVVFCGFGGVYLGLGIFFRERLIFFSEEIGKNSRKTIQSLQESLGGIRDILIDGTEEIFVDAFKKSDSKMRNYQSLKQFISSAPKFILEAIAMLALAIFTYIYSINSLQLSLMLPILGVLVVSAQKMLPLLQQIYSSCAGIIGAKSQLVDVLLIINKENPIRDIGGIGKYEFSKKIEFCDIGFAYPESKVSTLTGVNVLIKKGSWVGVVGATGSGKSTFVDLLMGLLTPSSGRIYIDSVELDRKSIRSWQKNIAHVPQSIFLTDSDVLKNIAFGISSIEINEDLVRRSANLAFISEAIESWPNAYQTKIGERGGKISGGQRQRIGIARALYKEASLIILDEATNALDLETEMSVMASLKELKKDVTLIFITHRIEALMRCDSILEAIDGQLVQYDGYDSYINSANSKNNSILDHR
jgi:ATP-binding cassette subfamily B protein